MARGVRNAPKGGMGSHDKRPQSAHTNAVMMHASVADWMGRTADAPIFHPTQEEWENPMAFIRSIRPRAELHGICKIIPPTTSTVPASRVIRGPNDETLQFHVRHQPLAAQPTASLDYMRFETSAEPFDMKRFCDLAYRKEIKLLGAVGGLGDLSAEAAYWTRRRNSDKENFGLCHIEYGNDVEGTAFCDRESDDPLGRSPWNMRVLPKVPGSTLQLLDTDVPGVSTPMLYIGMISATFAWHVEDHYLYSINYQHQGAAKTWYGVASRDADKFEKACEKDIFAEALAEAKANGEIRESDSASKVHSVLLEKTTMFSPEALVNAGVPVSRAVQRPGEFVVTFPRAYHAGFSHGFSIGEAVNFATGDWFLFGAECCERYRRVGRMPIVPHELLICRAAAELDEALEREALPKCMDEADARALAGVFVDMVRQQHAQRRLLVKQGAQQLWKEADQLTDCCRCKRLSYITVAIDNQVSSDIQETMCLDCAVAHSQSRHSHGGHFLKILCSRNIRALERRAKYLEEHSLLKGRTAEWLKMREGRGMEERKLYGPSPGVLPLPLPTEPFQWRRLPDIQDPIPIIHPIKFPVLPASGAPAPDSDLGLSTVASFGRGYPPLIPVKQRCGSISADLLESPPCRPSQSRWQPQSAPAQSMPAWQSPAQPNVVTSGWQQGSLAQDSIAEPALSQREPAVPQPGPSARSSPQPGQFGRPGSPAEPTYAAAHAAQQQQQPLPAFMEEDVPLPAPMDIQIQQNAAPRPAAQQKQMKGATQSWIPLTRIYPAQFDDAVPEPDTPPEAEAPRAKQHAAHKSAAGPKRKHEGLNEGKGHKKPKVVLQPAAAPAKAPQAAGPSSKAKVVLQPGAAPARAPQVAGPSSKAKLAEEGEVLGQEGVMHYRAVYHLADSPGGPMLDLKDLAKATGLKGRFSSKVSVRDMARKLWVLGRQAALAKGVPPCAICDAPQAHRCSGASAVADRFLLGLPHIQALYLLSSEKEREMLEAFCGDLWSVKEMQALDGTPVKQEAGPSKGSGDRVHKLRLVLPNPSASGQPLGTDLSFWRPSAATAVAMAQEADGALGKAFFNVMAQNPGTACVPEPFAMAPHMPAPRGLGIQA